MLHKKKKFLLLVWNPLQFCVTFIWVDWGRWAIYCFEGPITMINGSLFSYFNNKVILLYFWYSVAFFCYSKWMPFYSYCIHLTFSKFTAYTSLCRILKYLIKVRSIILNYSNVTDFWFSRLFVWAEQKYCPISQKILQKCTAFVFGKK